jgi:hypothetical protein
VLSLSKSNFPGRFSSRFTMITSSIPTANKAPARTSLWDWSINTVSPSFNSGSMLSPKISIRTIFEALPLDLNQAD